jgi:hypothetical protein
VTSKRLGDEAEELFERYLTSRSLTFAYEQEAGGKHPDFWIDTRSGTVVCEVRQMFASLPPGAGSIDVYDPIRRAVDSKRRQGDGVKGLHPYVVVLHAPFWPTDSVAMAGALFGNVGITMPFDPATGTADSSKSETAFGRDGKLRHGQNSRFSAIAVVRQTNPTDFIVRAEIARRLDEAGAKPGEGTEIIIDTSSELEAGGLYQPNVRVVWLDVFHSHNASLPLSTTVFDGPYDRQHGAVGNTFVEIAHGVDRRLMELDKLRQSRR